MAAVSDLINGAFIDLRVMTVNETASSAMIADALMRLNQVLDNLSAEGLSNLAVQSFQLVSGVVAYTLGNGGSFATTGGLRAQKVTAWRASYGTVLQKGGRVLSLAEFGQLAQQTVGESALIPVAVGADTAWPLINVRVFPPPSVGPGQLELDYWTPFVNYATKDDPVTLSPGFLKLLRNLLAQELYPAYPSPVLAQVIAAQAAQAKAAIIEQNAMSAPQPQPAAPQGQR